MLHPLSMFENNTSWFQMQNEFVQLAILFFCSNMIGWVTICLTQTQHACNESLHLHWCWWSTFERPMDLKHSFGFIELPLVLLNKDKKKHEIKFNLGKYMRWDNRKTWGLVNLRIEIHIIAKGINLYFL